MKRKWILPLLAAAWLCTACSLLPKEEELPDAPVMRAFPGERYTMVEVVRGDIIKTETIECSYSAAEQEMLSFAVGGERIAELYVSPGYQVKAGDLLAELDNTQINREIAAQQVVVSDLQRQTDQAKEALDMQYERLSRLNDAAAADYSRFDSQRDSANLTCLEMEDEYNYLAELLAVEQMALKNLQEELSRRQIYAGIDGTVLTITQSSSSETALYAGQVVCIVADLTTGSFTANVKDGLLQQGDTVMIVYDSVEHEAQVTELLDASGGKKTVRFQLSTPDLSLSAGTRGKITLETERREDVLCVPTGAVEQMDSANIVYYVDENGLKSSKIVETGLMAGGLVEIVSGLEEGEMVIQ